MPRELPPVLQVDQLLSKEQLLALAEMGEAMLPNSVHEPHPGPHIEQQLDWRLAASPLSAGQRGAARLQFSAMAKLAEQSGPNAPLPLRTWSSKVLDAFLQEQNVEGAARLLVKTRNGMTAPYVQNVPAPLLPDLASLSAAAVLSLTASVNEELIRSFVQDIDRSGSCTRCVWLHDIATLAASIDPSAQHLPDQVLDALAERNAFSHLLACAARDRLGTGSGATLVARMAGKLAKGGCRYREMQLGSAVEEWMRSMVRALGRGERPPVAQLPEMLTALAKLYGLDRSAAARALSGC